MNLFDLKIEEEIAPIFDLNLSQHSKSALLKILHSLPKDLSEIIVRQNTLKGFIRNPKRINLLFSYKLDIEEVYHFTKTFHIEFPHFKEISIFERIFSSKRENTELRSRAIQTTFLLHNIYDHYFTKITLDGFPKEFRKQIAQMSDLTLSFSKLSDESRSYSQDKVFKDYRNILKLCALYCENGAFKLFWESFFMFEAFLSIATVIADRKFTFPVFDNVGISILNMYHPLLSGPIKNSFSSDGSNVLVLSGPNMSGKSTLLRTISLCAYLAHAGLAVSADEMSISFFDEFDIHLHSRDNIHSGLSHFMLEVKNLKAAIQNSIAGKRVFAVFDEMFSGTNVEDASEIFEVTVKGLQKFHNSFFILTTHMNYYERVGALDKGKLATFFLDASLENSQPVFHFKMKRGWSTHKFGNLFFTNEGIRDMLS